MDFSCPRCAAPFPAGQRYCLACGALVGERRVDPAVAWESPGGERRQPAAPPAPALVPPPVHRRRAFASALGGAVAAGLLLGVLLTPDGGPAASTTLPASVLGLGSAPAQEASKEPADPATDSADVADSAPSDDSADAAPPDSGTDAGSQDLGNLGSGNADDGADDDTAPTPPPIRNAWIVTISGAAGSDLFARPDGFLAQLVDQGTLLTAYTPVSGGSLANGIALLSGRPPTEATSAGCPTYADGDCVQAAGVPTLPGRLTAKALSWRAYVQGEGTPCRHPELGAADPWSTAGTDGYRTARNPFVYFHELLDGGDCAANDVDLAQLTPDLADSSKTPNVSWVVPGVAYDGATQAGLDAFLAMVIPQITATDAYKQAGLIAIVPDSAPATLPGAPLPSTGALVISPFAKAGATVDEEVGPYRLLRTLADAFDVKPPGRARDKDLDPLGDTVFPLDPTSDEL